MPLRPCVEFREHLTPLRADRSMLRALQACSFGEDEAVPLAHRCSETDHALMVHRTLPDLAPRQPLHLGPTDLVEVLPEPPRRVLEHEVLLACRYRSLGEVRQLDLVNRLRPAHEPTPAATHRRATRVRERIHRSHERIRGHGPNPTFEGKTTDAIGAPCRLRDRARANALRLQPERELRKRALRGEHREVDEGTRAGWDGDQGHVNCSTYSETRHRERPRKIEAVRHGRSPIICRGVSLHVS